MPQLLFLFLGSFKQIANKEMFIFVITHTSVADGVDRVYIWPLRVDRVISGFCDCVCMCVDGSVCPSVCVFPHCERKMAWAINTKHGTHILYGSRSARIDPEVKGQGHMVT